MQIWTRQIEDTYSKLDKKERTSAFSFTSDASEIIPSALKNKITLDQIKAKKGWGRGRTTLNGELIYLIAESRSWCWLRTCCKKADSNFVILLGSILSRCPLTPA